MEFRIGQTVELIDNESMVANVGAIAVVRRVSNNYIFVVWKRDSKWNKQGDGGYYSHTFKLVTKGQQLLFNFMSATEGT